MAAITTLIEPREVVELTDLSLDFPLCNLRTIYNVELYTFRRYLCEEFYDLLIADLVDYSVKDEYNNTETYAVDDIVKWRDKGYFKAIQEATGKTPSNSAYWTRAPKFGTALYTTLWDRHLAEFLALRVLRMQLPFITERIGEEGVLQFEGMTWKAVDNKDEERLYDAVDSKLRIVLSNLLSYLVKNDDEDVFSESKPVKGCCDEDESEKLPDNDTAGAKNWYQFG